MKDWFNIMKPSTWRSFKADFRLIGLMEAMNGKSSPPWFLMPCISYRRHRLYKHMTGKPMNK